MVDPEPQPRWLVGILSGIVSEGLPEEDVTAEAKSLSAETVSAKVDVFGSMALG